MSEERARARRMRLSELHARANKWQEEAEAEVETDPAAEFERTGRLPEESGETAQPLPPGRKLSDEEILAKLQAVYDEFPGSITDPIAVSGYLNMQDRHGDQSPWKSPQHLRKFLNTEWRTLRNASIGLGVTFVLAMVAWNWWPWWSWIPIGLLAASAAYVIIETLRYQLFREDMGYKLRRMPWSQIRRQLVVAAAVAATFLIGIWLHGYLIYSDSFDWHISLWRLSLTIEVAIVGAAALTLALNWAENKWYPWRSNLILGSACLVITLFAWPFYAAGLDHIFYSLRYATVNYVAQDASIGLAYLIAAALIAFACTAVYLRINKGQPTGLTVPAFIRTWRQRPPAEAKLSPQPSQPQFSFQPERVIDLKVRREWRMPNFIFSTSRRHAALIWCGRCAGAVVLTFLLAIRFNVIRDDASVPKGMEAYYYAAIAGMILFAIGFLMFWRASKGRFDGGLTGRAIGEVLIAAAIFVAGGQLFPYQPMAAEIIQMVAIFMAVAGSAKFLRLPWLPWKR